MSNLKNNPIAICSSIMRTMSLIKANITSAKKSGGGGALQAKLYVLKRLPEIQFGQMCA
jgi:hypothetical protein